MNGNFVPCFVVVIPPVPGQATMSLFNEAEAAEKAFTDECASYGVEASTDNYVTGRMVLEDGTVIALSIDYSNLRG